MRPPWYEGASALVVGLARSGRAVCKLLLRHGCRVRGSDSKTDEAFSESLEELRRSGVEIFLGPQDESLLREVDLVVLSPGVPPGLPLIAEADRLGMTVISELEAAFQAAASPIVAVTGTNGKTTTVEMLGAVFRRAGLETAVAGNVDTALSEVVESVPTSGVLVVEVSSFQLERIADFRPHIAALLNIAYDHLDRHGDMSQYLQSKLKIFSNQRSQDVAVINGDQGELLKACSRLPSGRLMRFSLNEPVEEGVFLRGGDVLYRLGGTEGKLFRADSLSVTGSHNLANAMACSAAALAMDVPAPSIGTALADFKGLEHRMEKAAVIEGVTFINDSKATNPDSLRQALLAVPAKAVLIAGGRDKGTPFEDLASLVKKKTKRVILIGEAAGRMQRAWKSAHPMQADSLVDAVRLAWDCAGEGDWVLLSPGCASFDMFRDFEDRGRQFKEAVNALERRLATG